MEKKETAGKALQDIGIVILLVALNRDGQLLILIAVVGRTLKAKWLEARFRCLYRPYTYQQQQGHHQGKKSA